MDTSPDALKAALRQEVSARLASLPEAFHPPASAAARAVLRQQPAFANARALLFFAPLPGELDLWPLLEETLAARKLVALPWFNRQHRRYEIRQIRDLVSDLVPGHFGIREPAPACPPLPLNRLDFLLVPGVAFDVQGHRLGRGKGYFDRLLAGNRGIACGVAFDEQIVRAVPVAPHDVVMNCILTPTRWVTCFDPPSVLE